MDVSDSTAVFVMPSSPPIRLPRQWPEHVKAGILHAISLAGVVLSYARGRANLETRSKDALISPKFGPLNSVVGYRRRAFAKLVSCCHRCSQRSRAVPRHVSDATLSHRHRSFRSFVRVILSYRNRWTTSPLPYGLRHPRLPATYVYPETETPHVVMVNSETT